MLESRNFVPKVYADSRDYQALLKLWDLPLNSIKSNVDNFTSYINPEYCKSAYLKYLASYVGYKYDTNLSYEINRLIISYYRMLVKNRGCEVGIKLAASLAVHAVNISAGDQSAVDLTTSLVNVGFDEEKGEITIYIFADNYSFKIFDLLEVVRPAGVAFRIVKAESISNYDKISVSETQESRKESYTEQRHTVENTDVGFGEVYKE